MSTATIVRRRKSGAFPHAKKQVTSGGAAVWLIPLSDLVAADMLPTEAVRDLPQGEASHSAEATSVLTVLMVQSSQLGELAAVVRSVAERVERIERCLLDGLGNAEGRKR